MSTQAKIAFAKWLQVNDPFLFEVAKKRAQLQKAGTIDGLGFLTDINWGDLAKSAVDTVKNIAPTIMQYKTDSSLLKLQLKRAEQGLPPINAEQHAPTAQNGPKRTPETDAAAARIATASVKGASGGMDNLLPMVAIGGAAIYFLTRPKSRRR